MWRFVELGNMYMKTLPFCLHFFPFFDANQVNKKGCDVTSPAILRIKRKITKKKASEINII